MYPTHNNANNIVPPTDIEDPIDLVTPHTIKNNILYGRVALRAFDKKDAKIGKLLLSKI